MEMYPTGSSLPDCSYACGACSPCKRVMISFQCSVAESCSVIYRCTCRGRYYHVPSRAWISTVYLLFLVCVATGKYQFWRVAAKLSTMFLYNFVGNFNYAMGPPTINIGLSKASSMRVMTRPNQMLEAKSNISAIFFNNCKMIFFSSHQVASCKLFFYHMKSFRTFCLL